MKKALSFICIILLMSCKSKETVLQKNQMFNLSSDCPKEGKCNLEVRDVSTYEFKEDDGGVLYPKFIEKQNNKVFIFNYKKKQNPNLADDFYEEKVMISLPYEMKQGSYNNEELKNFDISYGRFCFCRDVAGYYPIENGTLTINNDSLELSFSIDSNPQKIKYIKIDFSDKK